MKTREKSKLLFLFCLQDSLFTSMLPSYVTASGGSVVGQPGNQKDAPPPYPGNNGNQSGFNSPHPTGYPPNAQPQAYAQNSYGQPGGPPQAMQYNVPPNYQPNGNPPMMNQQYPTQPNFQPPQNYCSPGTMAYPQQYPNQSFQPNSPPCPNAYAQPGQYPSAPPGYPQGGANSPIIQMSAAQVVPSHSTGSVSEYSSNSNVPGSNTGSIAASFFSEAPPVDPHKEHNPYIIHWNKAIGIGAGLNEKGNSPSLRGFPTYEITLYFVDEIFNGKSQHWNTKYEQAIKIFGFVFS